MQSRYYDPEICRFINADFAEYSTALSLDDTNLFAYCGNNPIERNDEDGEFWHILVGAIVGVVTQYVSDVVSNLASGKSFVESLSPTSTWADYASAAISGGLAATGIGLAASVAANATLGGVTYLANCEIKGEEANVTDFAIATGIGGISGLIGGKGADGKNLRGAVNTSKQILKTAVSPKKIAMYTGKIANCWKSAIVSGLRTSAAGFASNGLNYARRKITKSEA